MIPQWLALARCAFVKGGAEKLKPEDFKPSERDCFAVVPL